MNDKNNFLTIDALSSIIDEKVKRIKKGKMKIQMLEQLLDDVKDLQERLIIIKYKVMEKLASKPVEKNLFNYSNPEIVSKQEDSIGLKFELAKKVEDVEDQMSIGLNFELAKEIEVAENQISLMDSIAEISEENNGEIKQPKEVEIEELPPTKAAVQPVSKKPLTERKKNPKQKKPKEKVTVSQKIRAKHVSNIGKSIKLNARIGMVKQLFAGDTEKFKASIEKLNNSSNFEAASAYLDELKATGKWSEDNKWYVLLVDLIARRFTKS